MAGINVETSRLNGSPSNGTTPKHYSLQITGIFEVALYHRFLVNSAKLNGASGFLSKPPDVYVLVSVDSGQEVKKTGIKKKTGTPEWNENILVTVTDSSNLEFEVYCKAKIFDDVLFGSKKVKISHWVKKESENGVCK
jgi:Ca2+-dependent lipid-binding protein